MKECIDEGSLQAYFDGELEREKAVAVASHLACCLTCAQAARLIENENLWLSEALKPEFAENIPSESLRHRVDAAIAEHQNVESPQHGLLASLRNLFFPSPRRAFGYAALAALIVLSAVLGVIYLPHGKVSTVAQNEPAKATSHANPEPSTGNVSSGSITNQPPKADGPVETSKQLVSRKSTRRNAATAGLLPGERNYIRTIASLNATLKSDRPMRPSLQVEYAHNVALLDSAIEMTRDAARKNPRDPQAAQFMFAAYQSKVELLNQVADARRFNTQK